MKILENHRDEFGFREVADNPAVMRQMRALYHGKVRMIDDQIKRVVDYLESTDQMDNTIIVFTTDHGDMMGDHGLVTKWAMHYRNSIRVPLIACGAGVAEGAISSPLRTALDFYPTICDLAGVDLRPPLEGRSFSPILHGAENTKNPWTEITIELGPIRSIMTYDQWRLTIYDQPGGGQLFNLAEDPDEQHNLYHDPAYAEKRLELHELFSRAFMRAQLVPVYEALPRNEEGRPCLANADYSEMIPLPW